MPLLIGLDPDADLCVCRAVDTREFADVLVAQGYTRLIIQKGAGSYVPCQLLRGASGQVATLANGLQVEWVASCSGCSQAAPWAMPWLCRAARSCIHVPGCCRWPKHVCTCMGRGGHGTRCYLLRPQPAAAPSYTLLWLPPFPTSLHSPTPIHCPGTLTLLPPWQTSSPQLRW